MRGGKGAKKKPTQGPRRFTVVPFHFSSPQAQRLRIIHLNSSQDWRILAAHQRQQQVMRLVPSFSSSEGSSPQPAFTLALPSPAPEGGSNEEEPHHRDSSVGSSAECSHSSNASWAVYLHKEAWKRQQAPKPRPSIVVPLPMATDDVIFGSQPKCLRLSSRLHSIFLPPGPSPSELAAQGYGEDERDLTLMKCVPAVFTASQLQAVRFVPVERKTAWFRAVYGARELDDKAQRASKEKKEQRQRQRRTSAVTGKKQQQQQQVRPLGLGFAPVQQKSARFNLLGVVRIPRSVVKEEPEGDAM